MCTLSLCLFGAAFWAWGLYWAVDIPNSDDFGLYLEFINQYLRLEDVGEISRLIFSRHNEHYVATSRLAAIISYATLGYVNFIVLIAVGTLSVPLIVWLLYRSTPIDDRHKPLYFLPAAFIVFQPSYSEATQWATAAISNLAVMLFALIAIRTAAASSRWAQVAAVAAFLLATFTAGNGVLVASAIAVTLLLKRQFKRGAVWLVGFSVFFILLHGEQFSHVIDAEDSSSSISAILKYLLALLGSALAFSDLRLATVIGLLLVFSFAACFLKGSPKKTSVLFGFSLFLLFTAIAGSVARHKFGVSFAFMTPRYTFISALLLATSYLMVLTLVPSGAGRRRFAQASTLLSVLCSLLLFYGGVESYRGRQQVLIDSMVRWQLFQEGLAYPAAGYAEAVYREALERGTVRPGSIDVAQLISHPRIYRPVETVSSKIVRRTEYVLENEGYFLLNGWIFVKPEDNRNATISVIFTSADDSFVFDTVRRIRPDVAGYFRRPDLSSSGYLALVRKNDLPPGDYLLSFLIQIGDKTFEQRTRHTWSVP